MLCPSCGGAIPGEADSCPACARLGAAGGGATRTVDLSGTTAGTAPAAAPAIVSATVIAGRYRVEELAGRGGMGEVYRAHDITLDQTVAVKCLPAALAADAARLGRLLREVRVARQVAHPNVCRVYDVVESDGQHVLVMEWIGGETLEALLRRAGRLPPPRALALAKQICAGLAAVHERGVIHRDLKPSNVMIDDRGVARLTDFGLAEAAAVSGPRAREGTRAHMAPEQLARDEATARSDIYALGLLLYELLCGKPCTGRDAPPPSSVAADLDPAVDAIVLRCLERDPARRPASAREVGAALPGPAWPEEALGAAQQRADRIVAFREELAELRRVGVLRVVEPDLVAIERYHESLLRDLVLDFDVDVGERSRALSLGMRLVSLVGATALSASVFYFFYSVWDALGLAAQVAALTAAPVFGLLLTAVLAQRERAGHFATFAALASLASFIVSTSVLGVSFNMRSSPGSVLAWGLFALALAYGFELRVPFTAGLLLLAFGIAGTLVAWTGGFWVYALARPETLFVAGALCLAVPFLRPSQPAGFRAILDVIGTALVLGPTLILLHAGGSSYLPFTEKTVEIFYQFTGGLAGAVTLGVGIARRSKAAAYAGGVFLMAWIFMLLVHWGWNAMPRWLFFFLVGAIALGALALLRRLRAALAGGSA